MDAQMSGKIYFATTKYICKNKCRLRFNVYYARDPQTDTIPVNNMDKM